MLLNSIICQWRGNLTALEPEFDDEFERINFLHRGKQASKQATKLKPARNSEKFGKVRGALSFRNKRSAEGYSFPLFFSRSHSCQAGAMLGILRGI